MAAATDTIALEKYKSCCEEKQKQIVSRDKGHPYKHVGINDSGGHVRHYHIDGGILPKGKLPRRCDYLLLTDDTNPPTAYFIELKGNLADAEEAMEQVLETEAMCKQSIKGYKVQYRIVFGKGHGNYSSEFIKWRDNEAKGRVIAKRGEITDRF